MRDSTEVGSGAAGGSRQTAFTQGECQDADAQENTTLIYLDSPNTTSAITYKIQMINHSSTAHINRTVNNSNVNEAYGVGTQSTITVMEVKG